MTMKHDPTQPCPKCGSYACINTRGLWLCEVPVMSDEKLRMLNNKFRSK